MNFFLAVAKWVGNCKQFLILGNMAYGNTIPHSIVVCGPAQILIRVLVRKFAFMLATS